MEVKKRWALCGRKIPYTARGIGRLPCFRCGAPATQQWQICADGNLYRPICDNCDVVLNDLVLDFMGFPDRHEKMREYKRVMFGAE